MSFMHIHGVGLGLRGPHVPQILETKADVPWFEILADNYLDSRGLMARQLDVIRNNYTVTFHCVGMSLGSADALDEQYLKSLDEKIKRYEPTWVSDHVSFSNLGGEHFHDLLPLPYTEESLKHLIDRTDQVQNKLDRQILLENPSTYIRFKHSTIDEAEFLNTLADASGCGLLIDVNNAYVNAINHGESAENFLKTIKPHHVKQLHLGGYEDRGDYLLDAHNNPVSEPVWALYEAFINHFSNIPTLIEWDNDLPAFSTLMAERERAEAIQKINTEACA